MKRQVLFLSMTTFFALNALAQTPYDNFAPEQSVKPIIEMPKMHFKVANTNLNSEIRSIEFDKNTLSLNLLNESDSVLKSITLNPNDKKFTSIDPLTEKYYHISPYIIRKTKCFDFWERNVLFPKTKRSFFRTPKHPLPCPFPLNFSLLIITKKFGNLAKNRYICIV
jgi:hypothetical protein